MTIFPSDAIQELNRYIGTINKVNDFDLAWEWAGSDSEPMIKVFEEAEGHILVFGVAEDIVQNLRDALPDWDLEDAHGY